MKNKRPICIEEHTKEGYVKAIGECCDYIKNNLAEKVLNDFGENLISNLKFTINVSFTEILIVNVEKEYAVDREGD